MDRSAEAGKIKVEKSEHGKGEKRKDQRGDPVEKPVPRKSAECGPRQDRDYAEQTVCHGDAQTVHQSPQKTVGFGAVRVHPGTDDRQIHRDQRQHAGRQVQRKSPQKDQQQRQKDSFAVQIEHTFFRFTFKKSDHLLRVHVAHRPSGDPVGGDSRYCRTSRLRRGREINPVCGRENAVLPVVFCPERAERLCAFRHETDAVAVAILSIRRDGQREG